MKNHAVVALCLGTGLSLGACNGQTYEWKGDFPSEAVIITSAEMDALAAQGSIRYITDEEYADRKPPAPAVTLADGTTFANRREHDAPNASALRPAIRPSVFKKQVEERRFRALTESNQKAVFMMLYERLPEHLQAQAPVQPAELSTM